MAAESKVQVIISVLDKYSKGLDTFGGKMKSMGATVAKVSAVLAGVGVAAAGLSTKLGVDLVQTASAVEEGLYDVAAVAKKQLGEDALAKVGDIVDDLTVRFPIMGTEATRALEIIAQLGYGAEENLKNLGEAAVTLGTATSKDIGMAAQTLVSTLNQFDLASSDALRVTNLFTAAQFNSAAALDDVQVAMQYLGPTARALGKSLEETVTAVAMLRDIGIDASMVGTQLRMALLKLSKPTKQGYEALDKMGLTIDQVNPRVNSLAEIIRVLEGRLTDVGVAQQLFGTRAGSLMVSLANKGADAFLKLKEEITGTTAATDAVDMKMQSYRKRLDNVVASVDVLKRTIAGPLLDALSDFLGHDEEGIFGAINALKKMEDEAGEWGKIVKNAFDEIARMARDVFAKKFNSSLEEVYEFGTKVFTGLSDVTLKVAEAIKLIVEKGIDLVNWWSNLDSKTKDSYMNMAKWIALIGPAVGIIMNMSGSVFMLGGGMMSLIGSIAILKGVKGLGGLVSLIGTGGISGGTGTIGSLAALGGVMKWVGGPLVVGLVAYGLTRLISKWTGLDDVIQKGLEKLMGYKDTVIATDNATKNWADTIKKLNEKYGLSIKTKEEAIEAISKLQEENRRLNKVYEEQITHVNALREARIKSASEIVKEMDMMDGLNDSVEEWVKAKNKEIEERKKGIEIVSKEDKAMENIIKSYENAKKTGEDYSEWNKLVTEKIERDWGGLAIKIPKPETTELDREIDRLIAYMSKLEQKTVTIKIIPVLEEIVEAGRYPG